VISITLRDNFFSFERSGKRKTTQDDHYIQASEWKKVEPGEKLPFFFHNKEKNRHEVNDGASADRV
jgi:hypothetical protein